MWTRARRQAHVNRSQLTPTHLRTVVADLHQPISLMPSRLLVGLLLLRFHTFPAESRPTDTLEKHSYINLYLPAESRWCSLITKFPFGYLSDAVDSFYQRIQGVCVNVWISLPSLCVCLWWPQWQTSTGNNWSHRDNNLEVSDDVSCTSMHPWLTFAKTWCQKLNAKQICLNPQSLKQVWEALHWKCKQNCYYIDVQMQRIQEAETFFIFARHVGSLMRPGVTLNRH